MGLAVAFCAPSSELAQRTLFVELAGFGSKLSRDPAGKGDLLTDVSARGRVLLVNLRKVFAGKSLGNADQSRPQASMYKSDLAVNEPANQHIRTVPGSAGQCKDFMISRMSPPAAADGAARDGAGKRRYRTGRRLEHNTVCAHKCQGFSCCQDKSPSNVAKRAC